MDPNSNYGLGSMPPAPLPVRHEIDLNIRGDGSATNSFLAIIDQLCIETKHAARFGVKLMSMGFLTRQKLDDIMDEKDDNARCHKFYHEAIKVNISWEKLFHALHASNNYNVINYIKQNIFLGVLIDLPPHQEELEQHEPNTNQSQSQNQNQNQQQHQDQNEYYMHHHQSQNHNHHFPTSSTSTATVLLPMDSYTHNQTTATAMDLNLIENNFPSSGSVPHQHHNHNQMRSSVIHQVTSSRSFIPPFSSSIHEIHQDHNQSDNDHDNNQIENASETLDQDQDLDQDLLEEDDDEHTVNEIPINPIGFSAVSPPSRNNSNSAVNTNVNAKRPRGRTKVSPSTATATTKAKSKANPKAKANAKAKGRGKAKGKTKKGGRNSKTTATKSKSTPRPKTRAVVKTEVSSHSLKVEGESGPVSVTESTPDQSQGQNQQGKGRKRRKQATPEEWLRVKNKMLRMQGQAYMGYTKVKTGDSEKNIILAVRKQRSLGPPCDAAHCLKGKSGTNCTKFSEAARLDLFDAFWKRMNWEQRKIYVASLVDVMPVKKSTVKGRESKRALSLVYMLKLDGEKQRVCKKMFLSTLGIGAKAVNSWVLKASDNVVPLPAKRAKVESGSASGKKALVKTERQDVGVGDQS